MNLTVATVLRSGGRYDDGWVERLARGAARALPQHRFVCLSDLALALPGVERVPLLHDWPAWWAKLELFRPGLFAGRVVALDLDTVFAGDAAALAADPVPAFMEDFFHHGRVSSALMRFDGDALAFLYRSFAAEPARWMRPGSCGDVPNAVHGDQVVTDHLLRREGITPAFIQRAHPGLVDFYDPAKRSYGPVVVFIGDAKPDHAGEPIASLWSGTARVVSGPPMRHEAHRQQRWRSPTFAVRRRSGG